MSFWSIAFLGSTTIGGPAVGWFAQVAGDRWGLALGGVGALAAGLLGLINLRHADPSMMRTSHANHVPATGEAEKDEPQIRADGRR